MDVKSFKKAIKQAVKEAIQEELKDILLEAIKTPKVPAGIGGYGTVNESVRVTSTQPYEQPVRNNKREPAYENASNVREKYASLLNGMLEERNGNLKLDSNNVSDFAPIHEYRPPRTINTAGEGSSLPPGEVSLDQIAGLLSTK